MRIAKIALAALAVFLALAACGGPANDPGSVAKAFLERLQKMDFEGAKGLATEDGKKMLTMMQGFMAMASADDMKKYKSEAETGQVKIISVQENGDKATVAYSMKEGENTSLEMVKENGQWKVNFKKEM